MQINKKEKNRRLFLCSTAGNRTNVNYRYFIDTTFIYCYIYIYSRLNIFIISQITVNTRIEQQERQSKTKLKTSTFKNDWICFSDMCV